MHGGLAKRLEDLPRQALLLDAPFAAGGVVLTRQKMIDVLTEERPHIVSVATRFLDEHRDMVVACAEAGASIFLEKPMCRTLAEADAMIAACEKHGKYPGMGGAYTEPLLSRYIEMGMRFILGGQDGQFIMSGGVARPT